MAYRVVVRDSSDCFASNSIEYDCIDDAINAGQDLYARWTACRTVAVVSADLARDGGAYWSTQCVQDNNFYIRGEDAPS